MACTASMQRVKLKEAAAASMGQQTRCGLSHPASSVHVLPRAGRTAAKRSCSACSALRAPRHATHLATSAQRVALLADLADAAPGQLDVADGRGEAGEV